MQSQEQKAQLEQAKMEEVALSFQKAMKGIGTDEERIIREVTAYNNIQRQLIKSKYLVLTGNEITDDFKSEIDGYFLETVLGLFTPLDEYEARILNDAIRGKGTNEHKIMQILCSKEAEEIKKLKSAYKRVFRNDLEADLKDEESGDLGRIFRSLASGGRNENHGYDPEYILKETQNLYDAGQGKTGTDEKEFIRILCSKSFAELNAIFSLYQQKFEKDAEQVISSEFSGELRDALLAIEQIYLALAGQGTKERDLLQLLIRRIDIDLASIKNEYKRMYKVSLSSAVRGEVSGEFEKILLAMIGKE